MTTVWTASSELEAFDAVTAALAEGVRLEIVGGGSRRDLGRPVEADVVLDLSGLSGVVDYQPEELVVTVRPGTPMAELEALLASRNQQLAFEPPDFGPLWGRAAGQGTIGGCVMIGRGGPRRLTAGAPRDHFLGIKGVNGFGQAFAAGGRVVKNVTGFDLTKLIAGSFGTLCVATEMTFKVLPAPADTLTLVLHGLDDEAAVRAMSQALGSPAAVSAAAHLPADVAPDGAPATLIRLEGVTPSIRARGAHLTALLQDFGPVEVLDREESHPLWKVVGDAAFLADDPDAVVWKLSVPPTAGPAIAAAVGGRHFYDWGGGGLWLALPPAPDAHAARVRAALAQVVDGDGHATLMRAPEALRTAASPFQPLAPVLAALTSRVKQQFDPKGLFNPGRMYAGA
ncbi:MAG: glcE [Phenylobacterium sp.]|nr:glcE [Phenylobacterium sp.]